MTEVVTAASQAAGADAREADFDPTSPQARAAWKASMPAGAGVSGHA